MLESLQHLLFLYCSSAGALAHFGSLYCTDKVGVRVCAVLLISSFLDLGLEVSFMSAFICILKIEGFYHLLVWPQIRAMPRRPTEQPIFASSSDDVAKSSPSPTADAEREDRPANGYSGRGIPAFSWLKVPKAVVSTRAGS
jgi:hypothetical protein